MLLKLSVGFQLKILPRDTKWFLEAKTGEFVSEIGIPGVSEGFSASLLILCPLRDQKDAAGNNLSPA